MLASVTVTDDTWRTQHFRQNMVNKIEVAIQNSGSAPSKNAVEMENQVFSKAKSKDEYLSFVARLIIHINELGNKNQNMMQINTGNQQNQGQGNNMQGQGPMMGVQTQQNMGMMGQMNTMVNMNPNPMMGQQQQNFGVNTVNNSEQMQTQVGLSQSPSPMMQVSQQQLQQQQQQLQLQQQQMQQQQQQQQQMMGAGFMQAQQQQMLQQQQQQQQQMLQQQQQQLQQQKQMQNAQGQMQSNPQMQNSQGQMQPTQTQMQNPQLQSLLTPQQQQLMGVRGLANPQMLQNRVMGPQANMASQLSQMAQQQQRKVESVGMAGPYSAGPGQMPRSMGQSQFMPPVASQGIPTGPVPSPGSMNVPGQRGQNQGYVNSPGSATMMHSPAAPGINPSNNLHSFQGHYGTVPSPGQVTLHTPQMVAATPSPRSVDDVACFEKIKELRKYTDLLQRMIAKIGNDDVEKSSKMKKLLEILTNPNQRVSMDILLKCEVALKRMERNDATGGGSVPSVSAPHVTPSKEQASPFQYLMDSVLSVKNASAAHTYRRTFQPAMDALLGHSFGTCNDDDSDDDTEESKDISPIPWVLEKELRILDSSRFKISTCIENIEEKCSSVILECVLIDCRLPSVPHLKIHVPSKYPDDCPSIMNLDSAFGTTPFFTDVASALKSRMYYFSKMYTVTEILNAWEMSVRQASNPNPSLSKNVSAAMQNDTSTNWNVVHKIQNIMSL